MLLSVVFLGTGVSTALPRLDCLEGLVSESGGRNGYPGRCEVCYDGLKNPTSKNRRGNVSILVQYDGKNLLVDCGKTMRESALRWFPPNGIHAVDAVLLTHGHMDAIGGIDDLRGIGRKRFGDQIPIYLNEETETACRSMYGYLFPRQKTVEEMKVEVKRHVANIEWIRIHNEEHFNIHGIPIQPLPLLHGGDYISLGFAFGDTDPFVYLSDVKAVPDDTMFRLRNLGPIQTLVVDALHRKKHPTHFDLDDAIQLVEELKPKQAYFVGMTCGLGSHDDVQKELEAVSEEVGTKMSLAWDGLVVEL